MKKTAKWERLEATSRNAEDVMGTLHPKARLSKGQKWEALAEAAEIRRWQKRL